MPQVLIYRGEDGFFVAECSSLPGCVSQGSTKDEARSNIKEAVGAYIAALEADHLPVPTETFDADLTLGVNPLPAISGRECIRALERIGFEPVRQTGSHVILRHGSPFQRWWYQHLAIDPSWCRHSS